MNYILKKMKKNRRDNMTFINKKPPVFIKVNKKQFNTILAF